MGFWREHMPAGMFLRSGPDWHLDGAGVATLEAHLEERGIAPEDVDPLPIDLFLEYADWFTRRTGLEVREDLVGGLEKVNGRFEATLESGERIRADAVVAAPACGTTRPSRTGPGPAARAVGPHLRPDRVQRARGRARDDRGWPPERVRVGRPAPRARRGADRHRPPPRRPALRARELALRRRARRAHGGRPRLLAQPPDERAGGDRAAVLGGRAADARGLADAAAGLGPHPPAARRPRRRAPTWPATTRCT